MNHASNSAINPRMFTFMGSSTGPWRVMNVTYVCGEPLPAASHVNIIQIPPSIGADSPSWWVSGTRSNARYTQHSEQKALQAQQADLGRPNATHAALIPIRKNDAWWALAQDERREILEAQSHHIAIGMRYLPAIARRLFHCRDLGLSQDFDFITWFEYAPADSVQFDELLAALRATPEWRYVDREVDMRLIREASPSNTAI